MHRLLAIMLLGAAWVGTADAGEWRTQSEQPFCLNRDDVLQYLLVMNVEGFKGRVVPGCSTLKAGLRVTMVNDEDSDRPGRSRGIVKIRLMQGRKSLVGYTLADKE